MNRYLNGRAQRWVLYLVGLLLLVLGMNAMPGQAQSVSDVYITPNSGVPGTMVTLVSTNKDFSFQCYAGGVSLGTVGPGGTLSYTVPGDAAAGSAIDFRCYITNVDTSDSVGVFSVSVPPPVDGDGDGVPDSADACPQVFAQTQNGCPDQPPADSDGDGVPDKVDACPQVFAQTQNGCPDQQPPQVVDSDGDGLLDNVDACPQVFAQTQNGCPDQGAAPTNVLPPTPTFGRIEFPNTGPCVVVTRGNSRVNVRQGPAIDSPVVSQLNPGQGYPVTLMTADNRWYQLEAGWVSASVTQLAGDCSGVPLVSYNFSEAGPTPTSTVEMIARPAPTTTDWNALLAGCPTLIDSVLRRLTFQGILQLLGMTDNAERCARARSLLEDTAFHHVFTPLEFDFDAATAACPSATGAEIAAYNDFLQILQRIDTDFARAHFSSPPAEDTLSATWGAGNACDVIQLNVTWMAEVGPGAGLTNNELLTVAVAACTSSYMDWSTDRQRVTILHLIRAGFTGADLLRNPHLCEMILEVGQLGSLSERQLQLFAVLVQTCGFTDYRYTFADDSTGSFDEMSAALLIDYVDRVQGDLDTILGHVSALCADPLNLITSVGHSLDEQRAAAAADTNPDTSIPLQFQDCPQVYRLLARRAADLPPSVLFTLLLLEHPCDAALGLLSDSTRSSILPVPIPEAARGCFTGQTVVGLLGEPVRAGGDLMPSADRPFGTLVLADGTVIRQGTDFRTLLLLLNRDPRLICRVRSTDPDVTGRIHSTSPDFGQHTGVGVSSDAFTSIDPHALEDRGVIGGTGGTTPVPADATTPAPAGGSTPIPTELLTPIPPGGSTPVPPAGTTPVPAVTTPASVGGTTPVLVVTTPAPVGGTTPIPSGGSTPIPARGMTSVPPRASTPIPSSGGAISPTHAPGATTVALLPPSEALADMHNQLDTLLYDTSQLSMEGVLGAFQAADTEASPYDIYLLTTKGVRPLTVDTPQSETYPVLDADGRRVAFISTAISRQISLQMIDIVTGLQTTLLTTTAPDLIVLPFAPAWTQDGLGLLVTLGDRDGHMGIYLLDLSNLSAAPTLLIQDASEPAITADGNYLAYVLGRNIFVRELSSGATMPITEQPENSTCDMPSFDKTGLTLYFICADTGSQAVEYYRYDLGGLTLLPVDLHLVGDSFAGPTINALTLSDGQTISVVDLPAQGDPNQTTMTPLVTVDNQRVRNFRWRAYSLTPFDSVS